MKNVHIQVAINELNRERFKEAAAANSQVPSALIRNWIEDYTIKTEEKQALESLNAQADQMGRSKTKEED